MRILLQSVLVVTLLSCGGTNENTVIRLVDEFPSASITGTMEAAATAEPTEWRFDADEEHGFTAGAGVTGLTLRDGGLTGRSSTSVPVIHVERTHGLDDPDVLHEVIIRARISEGTNLWVTFGGDEDPGIERAVASADDFPWPLTSPIVAGDAGQTYTISAASASRASFPSSRIRHILLRPTDVSGADFEIESVRLVFRKEHLASIPAGVGWQGLSEIYRETIVTRAPEEASFELSVPSSAFFDLAVGTLEESPVTFRVSIDDEPLLTHTVTTPHRWETVPIDLTAYGDRQGTLTLSLSAEQPGAIGFWGAPVLRQRNVQSADGPRGVIVVLIDTLRSDRLDAYGHDRETAPHIRSLAENGALFKDAIAQGAWTKVSVPSMLSSTYPTSNGIYEMYHKLPGSADTMAEAFRAAGYATWAGSGNGFSGRSTNLHQGVEVFHENGSLQVPEGQSRSKSARILVDRLLPWLESHHDVPFFVYLHPIDPHSPYEPYRPYDTKWGAPDGKERHDERVEKVRPFIESDFQERMGLPLRGELEEAGVDAEAFVQHELDMYDGSIRAADAEIGRVLEKLSELGLEEDTLVVFLSDHGEEFLDHGGHFHEENVYGELTNVPLVMRWPRRIAAETVIEDTVEIVDVVPTILDLVGLPVPEKMQGESLKALLMPLSGERWTPKPAITEWTRRTDQRDEEMVDARSIILDGYKLIHNFERPDGFPEYELYDHAKDPLDQNDIASDHAEIVERLASQLAGWHEWALANALPSDAESIEALDSEELERLRSLGYVQ